MLIEIILGLILLVSVIILWRVNQGSAPSNNLDKLLEEKHRAMIVDINDSLNKSSEKCSTTFSVGGQTLNQSIAKELP